MSLESIFKLSLIMNMVDNLTGPLGRVSGQVGNSVSGMDRMGQTMGGMAKAGAVMAGVGAEITSAVLAPVQATFETRRAIGELASLGVKDLGAVERAAKDFSNTWSGTTKSEFITAAYDIKSGISSLSDEGVAQFTELSGLTAKATKSTIAEMTSLFATGYGIYKDAYGDLSDLEFGGMFSSGISASVKQFKTTGSGMAQAIQSLGASATTAQVPLEEQLSILGMLQATMGGGEAGTKYKAFLRSAVKGGEELGLTFMDANNQLLSLPEILDRLRGKFGETMDAAEKMELQRAFGDAEAVSLIDLMYTKTGDLQSNILGIYDALGSGTTVATEMATAMNGMEPDQWVLLQQNIRNVGEIAGGTLLPTINDIIGKGLDAARSFGNWAEQNQDLVRIVMILLLAFGGFLTVAGGTIAVFGTIGLIFTKTFGAARTLVSGLRNIKSGFKTIRLYGMFAADGLRKGFSIIRTAGAGAIGGIKNVAVSVASMAKTAVISGASALKSMALGLIGMAKQAVITAVTALPGLIASVWSFTAALLANPITWVVVGIVALIAALVLLWQNWDTVTAFLKGAWTSFCTIFHSATDAIKNAFGGVIGWVQDKISWFGDCGKRIIDTLVVGIMSVVTKPLDAIKGAFASVINWITEKVSWFRECGGKLIGMLAAGIMLVAIRPAEAVKNIFMGVIGWVTEKISWFGDCGKRIINTLVVGIMSVVTKPLEAIKGAFASVINWITEKVSWFRECGGKLIGMLAAGIMLVAIKPAEAVKNIFMGVIGWVTEKISWFGDCGKRIINTLVGGIKAVAMKPVEAIKGIFQKVRNLLPFSDAKEGPLSTLTLSGRRTMTTYAEGVSLAQGAPGAAVSKGLEGARSALERPVRPVKIRRDPDPEEGGSHGGTSGRSMGTSGAVIIQKLYVNADISKMKELPMLLNLVKELIDGAQSNGGDEDAVPQPT